MSKPLSIPRIRYRCVGEDDYMLHIDVSDDGAFIIDYGDYTSHKPTRGELDRSQMKQLTELLAALGEPREHPAPADSPGFVAELTVGDGPSVRYYRFWEGALDTDPALKAVVRLLEVLG
jgi:hypothetical protein